ncbi:MAG: helix-turn-helix domain-containing protein [Candidatus Binataceae bacterium]
MNLSKELLRQRKTKIVDVAPVVGFHGQAHFITVYRGIVGMTPRQFRRSSFDRLVDRIVAADAGESPSLRIWESSGESS